MEVAVPPKELKKLLWVVSTYKGQHRKVGSDTGLYANNTQYVGDA